jgi:hypothetical protein|tara:strand:+ start:662 stop:1420 length:759 start_codon:yes stop_codon:yes gene_type:complete
MDVSKTIINALSEGLKVTDLSDNIQNQKYYFYLLDLSKKGYIFNNDVSSSFICIDGQLSLNGNEVNKFQGYHISPFQKLKFSTENPAKALLGSTNEIDFSISEPESVNEEELIPLSDYKVDKPWGFENWYTDNLDNPSYALKRIHMEKGFQSSLQSHQYKSETNYVIDGEALVLYGLDAPSDLNKEIVIKDLSRKIYSPFTGWSNKVNELHRVIAHTSYDAIEISTPELDDVVRWADDNKRSSGRIDTEHSK